MIRTLDSNMNVMLRLLSLACVFVGLGERVFRSKITLAKAEIFDLAISF